MDKVSLAKKTAKLMVAKLSPQELENELYQLLIMLPDSDLDYVHDDVESGEIAGSPHPVDVLQGGDDNTPQIERMNEQLDQMLGPKPTEQASSKLKDSDEIDEIISKMYSETLTFEKYLEDSDLVSEVDIDSMSGVVNIYWTDVQMGGYITQATPFWADVDDIPIQVETTDGVLIDNGGNPVNVHFHTSEYIEEGFLQFMRAYYDKLPEILAKSKDIVDRYEGFQEDQSGGMDDINYKTDKALEQWSLEGAESLTDEQKDLIYGTNGVHTDYGWNEVVSEFITTYAKPEYQSTSLDEIPFGGFDISENEQEDFRSQLNDFVNEFEKEEYMVSDYYLPNLQPREFNL